MTERKLTISEEEIELLSKNTGAEKFLKRQGEFVIWIESFIETAKRKNNFPADARLMEGMTIPEMALYLNSLYWKWITSFVKKFLKDGANGERINHYKIAATIEYIVMKYLPFENEKGEPLKELNADFTFHVALQILFNWNIEKDRIKPKVIRDLLKDNKPTKDFIDEHRTWLRHHAHVNEFVIFSNMQTMRLFHYWFRDPKDDGFNSF